MLCIYVYIYIGVMYTEIINYNKFFVFLFTRVIRVQKKNIFIYNNRKLRDI